MQKNDRTLWAEGMFLGPQHFQQHDRFLLNTMALLVKASAGTYAYGLINYEFDTLALNQGKFAVTKLAGIFPDGTPFNFPEDGELPAALDISSECRNAVVTVALPLEGQQEKDAVESRSAKSFARYIIKDRLISDRHSPDAHSEDTVFTAGLWTRLTLSEDENTAFYTIPLCRIMEKRDDDQLILDNYFYPCAMSLQASTPLQKLVRELTGLIEQRTKDLASRIGTATATDASQLNQLLLLQLLNRAAPLLRHITEGLQTHPETLYRELVQLAGELSTITRANKLAPEYTKYLHRDQYHSFAPLFEDLRQSLNHIVESATTLIPVTHVNQGRYAASIQAANLFDNARFVLAAKAKVPLDELIKYFPQKTTISSRSKLRGLVTAQARGIALRHLTIEPNSIPKYENFVYFELHNDDPLWEEISQSGDLALHVAGRFSELQMQLWAIEK